MSIPLLSSLSQRAAQRAKTAARKARRKAKAAMIGTRKRRKVIRISTYDAQWSKLVRERDGHTCRKPGCGNRAAFPPSSRTIPSCTSSGRTATPASTAPRWLGSRRAS